MRMTHTSACVIHICVVFVSLHFFMFYQLAQRPTILRLGVACGQPPRQHRLAFVTVTQLRHTFTHTKQGQKVPFQWNCSQARINVRQRFKYLSEMADAPGICSEARRPLSANECSLPQQHTERAVGCAKAASKCAQTSFSTQIQNCNEQVAQQQIRDNMISATQVWSKKATCQRIAQIKDGYCILEPPSKFNSQGHTTQACTRPHPTRVNAGKPNYRVDGAADSQHTQCIFWFKRGTSEKPPP